MAWSTAKSNGPVTQLSETYTLPGSATTEYSSVIDPKTSGVGPGPNETRTISVAFNPSAVTGTNLDIALYGADDEAGTNKFLLKDALVADLTADNTWVAGTVDLNLYPAAYYFIAWTSDTDEDANTIDVRVFAYQGAR